MSYADDLRRQVRAAEEALCAMRDEFHFHDVPENKGKGKGRHSYYALAHSSYISHLSQHCSSTATCSPVVPPLAVLHADAVLPSAGAAPPLAASIRLSAGAALLLGGQSRSSSEAPSMVAEAVQIAEVGVEGAAASSSAAAALVLLPGGPSRSPVQLVILAETLAQDLAQGCSAAPLLSPGVLLGRLCACWPLLLGS
jgi:hypothetical protein